MIFGWRVSTGPNARWLWALVVTGFEGSNDSLLPTKCGRRHRYNQSGQEISNSAQTSCFDPAFTSDTHHHCDLSSTRPHPNPTQKHHFAIVSFTVVFHSPTPIHLFGLSKMFTHIPLGTLLAAGLLGFSTLASSLRFRSEVSDGIFPDVDIQLGGGPAGGYPRCPDKWRHIAKELKYWFIGEDGRCTSLAAQAVRMPFHDCFPSGGCDGSIILTDECTTRIENEQVIPICGVLYRISVEWEVGAADLINFAACESLLCPLASVEECSNHHAYTPQHSPTRLVHMARTSLSTLDARTRPSHAQRARFLLALLLLKCS